MATGLTIAAAAAALLLGAITGASAAVQPAAGSNPADAPLLATDLLLRAVTPELDFAATLAPEMALAPPLARQTLATARQYQAKMRADAARAKADAVAGGYPARPYAVAQQWTTRAETPALLAFSGLLWEYTGGAHGNSNYAVALWDRARQRPLATADLFADPKAALAALTPVWCKALGDARRRKRGDTGPSAFEDCPPLADLPIVPTGLGTIATLTVLAAPYVAGSYAEGSYEVPLDPAAVLPLLKPEWRATFGADTAPAR